MLAARASTARNVQRIARSFATAVDTAGVKVAAVNHNQPTSSVTVLVKAGSRFETKDGVANALKNFAFKVCLTFFFYCRIFITSCRARQNVLQSGQFVRASFTGASCQLASEGSISLCRLSFCVVTSESDCYSREMHLNILFSQAIFR